MGRRLIFLTIAAFVAALVGCTPTVSLRGAVFRGVSLTGANFDANLEIHNPNTFDVQVRSVRANVIIENVPGPIPIDAKPERWVPAGQSATVAVPFTVMWTQVPTVLASTLSATEVNYRVVGRADVTATQTFQIEKDAYKFEQEGTLPRRVFVGISPNGFSFGVGQFR
ncbi:MAG: LEA type 2 family protein [Polyangiaceae bacterium]